jgi:hypothetical protein
MRTEVGCEPELGPPGFGPVHHLHRYSDGKTWSAAALACPFRSSGLCDRDHDAEITWVWDLVQVTIPTLTIKC